MFIYRVFSNAFHLLYIILKLFRNTAALIASRAFIIEIVQQVFEKANITVPLEWRFKSLFDELDGLSFVYVILPPDTWIKSLPAFPVTLGFVQRNDFPTALQECSFATQPAL